MSRISPPAPGRGPLLLLALAMPGLAWAQVPPAAPVTRPVASPANALPLTLAQAIRKALEQNPRVQQSLLAIAESGDDRRAAAAALMPTVAAQATGQRAKNNLDAFIGIPTPHGPEVVGPFNWGQVGVEAQVSLFDLSLWKKWRASQHAETSARAQGRAVREEITALVVGQYLRALRAAASVRAGESRVDLAEALAKLAESQQKQGVGTKLDTLRAQVQLQTERQRLIQAQTQQFTALAGLGRLLDLEPGTHLDLTDTLAAPALPGGSFQETYQAGLGQRPELAALDAREKAAENLRQAAQGLRLPTLVATGAYSSTGLQSQPWATTYQVSLGLRVPLFTGGLVSSHISRARSEQVRIQEARRDVRAQVGFEIQVARAELEAAAHEVEVAGLAVTLSTEALTQARHRFEAGVSNNIEVINAQDELARANENQIGALYRLNQSRADLARATGQLESLFAR
ncbi:secretion protein [Geothrix oryzae]|uniref:Secretion protein n=1 Tax=Geothrix oryzae TaxID=2927975 RepID=A0ABN6UY87_9BACT|nr:TolC family protein [Geothrix oryzae]BDU70008.1 secretion protein [Geothrix oryzae]